MKPNFQDARAACRAELRPISALHIIATSALGTSVLMLTTGTDLGPFAPLIISQGIYLASFGMLIETGLLLRQAWHCLTRWVDRRSNQAAKVGS